MAVRKIKSVRKSAGKVAKISGFDCNSPALANAGLFGLPFDAGECDTIIIPVPWDVTVSFASGTAGGPKKVLEAGYQVDLFDPFLKDAWKFGIGLDEFNPEISRKSKSLRKKAEKYIDALTKSGAPGPSLKKVRDEINAGSKWLNHTLRRRALELMGAHKIVGLIGGDHSTPLGLMEAVAQKHGEFGILQIDAHADLRESYEGFDYSHASIMYNAIAIPEVSKLVQVGIRDYCDAESKLMERGGKIKVFYDREMKYSMYRGESWDRICNRIIRELPEKVYLSFDIDGLDAKLAPNTGTPVAGGLEADQVLFLLEKVALSGRKIVSFDINEIGAHGWDANVAARMLYRIANISRFSIGTK
jgi:agmatinase